MSEIILSKLLPDPADPRDYIFEPDKNVILPDSVDLRPFIGVQEDQLRINDCGGNAGGKISEMYLISAGMLQDTPATDNFDMSRLFPYNVSRKALGLLSSDSGTTGRELMRAIKNVGICRELLWPYDANLVTVDPNPEAYEDAKNYKLDGYYRIPLVNIDDALYAIKYALAKGWPIAVGMRVGQKIFSLKPEDEYTFVHPTINPLAGGHEMVIVGYFYRKNILYLIILNSWGKLWCVDGAFYCMATIPIIDGIDLWVAQGFNGIERVGVDQTKPIPAPEPIPPAPIPPAPQPDPVPPAPVPPEPIPPPAPVPPHEPVPPIPDPQPAKKSNALPLVIGALVVAAFIFYHFTA